MEARSEGGVEEALSPGPSAGSGSQSRSTQTIALGSQHYKTSCMSGTCEIQECLRLRL